MFVDFLFYHLISCCFQIFPALFQFFAEFSSTYSGFPTHLCDFLPAGCRLARSGVRFISVISCLRQLQKFCSEARAVRSECPVQNVAIKQDFRLKVSQLQWFLQEPCGSLQSSSALNGQRPFFRFVSGSAHWEDPEGL